MNKRFMKIYTGLRPMKWHLLLISMAMLTLSCDNGSGTMVRNSAEERIPAVEAVEARYGSLPLTERLNGVVKAKNQIQIYPEISAAVTDVPVHNGDLVRKGQPLVFLRDREFQERLKQSKAYYQIALAQAKQAQARNNEIRAQLKRTESLAEKELASLSELEAIQSQAIAAEANLELAEARVEEALANVEESESQLAETIIRAPVSGSVGNRNVEVGMLVSPNTRLFTLGQLENLEVEVILTDRMLNYIEIGQRSEIASDVLSNDALEAPLSRISPFLNPVTHSTTAEINLANPERTMKPGMFVTVDIFYGESENATLVPLSALYENPGSGETGGRRHYRFHVNDIGNFPAGCLYADRFRDVVQRAGPGSRFCAALFLICRPVTGAHAGQPFFDHSLR